MQSIGEQVNIPIVSQVQIPPFARGIQFYSLQKHRLVFMIPVVRNCTKLHCYGLGQIHYSHENIHAHIAYTLDDYVYICITTNRLLYNQTCTDRRCRFAIVLFVFFRIRYLNPGRIWSKSTGQCKDPDSFRFPCATKRHQKRSLNFPNYSSKIVR